MQVHSFNIPLHRPFRTAAGDITHREGFWIRDQHAGGECWAECAPLPGFSPDTLEENRKALSGLEGVVNELAMQPTWELQLQLLDRLGLPPALEFAVSVLAVDRACREQMLKVAMFLNMPVVNDVHVNGVLNAGEPAERAQEALKELMNRGIRDVKCKVDGRDPGWAASLSRLARRFPSLSFKLDFNGSVPIGEVRDLADTLHGELLERIRYVEDPCQVETVDQARRQRRGLGGEIVLALDACVRRGGSPPLASIIGEALADVLVIKPTSYGAVHRLNPLATEARGNGLSLVFTTMFETGIGRAQIAQVAGLFGSPEHSHGMLTGQALRFDVRDDDWLRRCAVSIPPCIGWNAPSTGTQPGWSMIKSNVTSLSAQGLSERII